MKLSKPRRSRPGKLDTQRDRKIASHTAIKRLKKEFCFHQGLLVPDDVQSLNVVDFAGIRLWNTKEYAVTIVENIYRAIADEYSMQYQATLDTAFKMQILNDLLAVRSGDDFSYSIFGMMNYAYDIRITQVNLNDLYAGVAGVEVFDITRAVIGLIEDQRVFLSQRYPHSEDSIRCLVDHAYTSSGIIALSLAIPFVRPQAV